MDPAPDPAIFVLDLQDANIKLFFLLFFNKSEEGEGMTADRFYKGVRQVPGTCCPVDPMTFCCGSGSVDPCP